MDQEQIEIKLQRATDDPAENDPKFQEELSEISKSLRTAGVTFAQGGRTFDAIGAHGYALAEYAIKELAPVAIQDVTRLIGIWLLTRNGRRARIKIGDIEAEARTPEEVEKLLKSFVALHQQKEPTP